MPTATVLTPPAMCCCGQRFVFDRFETLVVLADVLSDADGV